MFAGQQRLLVPVLEAIQAPADTVALSGGAGVGACTPTPRVIIRLTESSCPLD